MYYPQQRKANQQYLQTQVMSADPLQLVILTYDVAISACRSGEAGRALDAISELQLALNHDQGGQMAADLLGLYLYCADLIRGQQMEEAVQILSELRQTWTTLRTQLAQQPQQQEALSLAA